MSHTAFQIHDEADYHRALTLLDELWGAEPGSPESVLLNTMAARIAAYEKLLRNLPPARRSSSLLFTFRSLYAQTRDFFR